MTTSPTQDAAAPVQMFTIGELAARTGVATSALRFYEERGLIGSVRTPAGHRRYWRAMTRRVAFIVFAQRIGLTLEEIAAELATLPTNRAPHKREWARLSLKWSSRLAERIEELKRLERGLTDCIGCGCLSLSRCHVLNAGDRMAARGAGPRFWLEDERAGEG